MSTTINLNLQLDTNRECGQMCILKQIQYNYLWTWMFNCSFNLINTHQLERHMQTCGGVRAAIHFYTFLFYVVCFFFITCISENLEIYTPFYSIFSPQLAFILEILFPYHYLKTPEQHRKITEYICTHAI